MTNDEIAKLPEALAALSGKPEQPAELKPIEKIADDEIVPRNYFITTKINEIIERINLLSGGLRR